MTTTLEDLLDVVSVRQLESADLVFIYDSFIACLANYQESITRGYHKEYSRELFQKILTKALTHEDYSIFVVSHKDDSNNIVAYIIANPKTNSIFFNYTKYSYRKLGMQKYVLLPLVVDNSKTISVNWPTKEMLKAKKSGKVVIENKFLESLLEVDASEE